jgi:hypothetical protein
MSRPRISSNSTESSQFSYLNTTRKDSTEFQSFMDVPKHLARYQQIQYGMTHSHETPYRTEFEQLQRNSSSSFKRTLREIIIAQDEASMDPAMLKLTSAVDTYHFHEKTDLDGDIIDHLLELALQVRGEARPDIMKSLPRDKKMVIISQVVGQSRVSGESKGPRYYVDLIVSTTAVQLAAGKTRAEQLVDMVTRSITGSKPSQPIKEIIMELKVQCQCQSIR